MNSWTEFHIGLVYYSSLLIAFFAGILSWLYLQPRKLILKIIQEKTGLYWSRSFMFTLLTAGLLGAMSVCFNSCDGDYHDFIGDRNATIQVGLKQVSAGCISIAFITGIWFFILVILRLSSNWRIQAGPLIRMVTAFSIFFWLLMSYESIKTGGFLDLLNPFRY